MITDDEKKFLEEQQLKIEAAQTHEAISKISAAQQALAIQEQSANTFKEQLSLADELDTIEHLLRGHVLKKQADGSRDWGEPDDEQMMVLTEYGVHLFMNTIQFYINKNTLLSNYSEDLINDKMRDFGTDLADTIFMESDKVFRSPTFEDCENIFNERINKKVEIAKFELTLAKKEVDEDKLREEFIDEIRDKGVEIIKIKEQVMKNKYKRFLILMRQVQDSVHSTYLRALYGQERKTLRQHYHISENINPIQQPKPPNKLNPLNWLTGK